MLVYRLVKTSFGPDLTGEGARLFGGRWNQIGTPCLYTAGSLSLALLELLVHIRQNKITTTLQALTIEVPADDVEVWKAKDLPQDWRELSQRTTIAAMGNEWLLSKRSLSLVVPSAVIPTENCWLINPLHPGIKRIELKETIPFSLDGRLL